jgi:ABC-type spermidine/putrescine transport system permease subunit II
MDLGSRPMAGVSGRDPAAIHSRHRRGGLLVFIPAAGELVIPTLVGDASQPMIGRVISDEFSSARDWPMASAVAVVLLILMVVPTMLYSRFRPRPRGRWRRRNEPAPPFLITCALLRLCVLLHPDPVDDRLQLQRLAAGDGLGRVLDALVCLALSNRQVWDALVLSLKIAFVSATGATILGTMAGIALARFTRFRGRTLFSGLVTAPLVMPEVITGISSLMLLHPDGAVDRLAGQRGFTTITLAHITFSMVFVTTIVQSRMLQADRAIEEAAMDLGSRPWQVLRDITLPVISPAILSGWLWPSPSAWMMW